MDWPVPSTLGKSTTDMFAMWITYHFPYTDEEAGELGMAVIDATCAVCGHTERITIPMPKDPADDVYPVSGISEERSLFTMAHLHGRRTSG